MGRRKDSTTIHVHTVRCMDKLTEYFRGMTPATDGLPQPGRSKRTLGAKPEETISPDGTFGPGTGGMSVSPETLLNVPNHRRPRGFGHGSTGPDGDVIYAIKRPSFASAALQTRADPARADAHALVEPEKRCLYDEYLNLLAATRQNWRRAWP